MTCDACLHDLEALDEQAREAEHQAATWFLIALRKRQLLDVKLDEAAACRPTVPSA